MFLFLQLWRGNLTSTGWWLDATDSNDQAVLEKHCRPNKET